MALTAELLPGLLEVDGVFHLLDHADGDIDSDVEVSGWWGRWRAPDKRYRGKTEQQKQTKTDRHDGFSLGAQEEPRQAA
jgi:hypothetical protein